MQEEGDQNGAEGQQQNVRQLPEQKRKHQETERDEEFADELRISHEPLSGTVPVIHRLCPLDLRIDNGNGEAWFRQDN
jgi:hypothetical protein